MVYGLCNSGGDAADNSRVLDSGDASSPVRGCRLSPTMRLIAKQLAAWWGLGAFPLPSNPIGIARPAPLSRNKGRPPTSREAALIMNYALRTER